MWTNRSWTPAQTMSAERRSMDQPPGSGQPSGRISGPAGGVQEPQLDSVGSACAEPETCPDSRVSAPLRSRLSRTDPPHAPLLCHAPGLELADLLVALRD